ncbi:APC family permease [Kineococcus sp. NPDC059986]|uniref:APC family permease n=1 Tax=Kineococcus sp. NPDC059986 TaxID=3155538 RepID=UPI00344DD821
MAPSAPLARRLGLGDAVALGLGSMLGAGVFAAFGPATAAAGPWVLLSLAVAAVVAWCNATATAQLAAAHPGSGGVYLSGREELGPWWGFVAGWGFVVGKTASCAAVATTFAAHVAPTPWQRPTAAVAVVLLTAVNLRGIARTARLTRVLLVLTLLALTVVVVAALAGPGATGTPAAGDPVAHPGPLGVLQGAGLLFFAFAGYARVATLGEEVRDPERTIPRAVTTALAAAVVVYAAVGAAALHALGPAGLADRSAPLAAAAATAGWPWTGTVVRAGAAAAALGVLLALVAGVGRTALAMARHGDLPRPLAAVHPRWQVPHRAELAVAVVVLALVLTVDLRTAIGFSSCGVLVYYLVANVAAWRQAPAQRRYPRTLQAVGALGCVTLVLTLPARSVVVGLLVLLAGVALRVLLRRRVRATPGPTPARRPGSR